MKIIIKFIIKKVNFILSVFLRARFPICLPWLHKNLQDVAVHMLPLHISQVFLYGPVHIPSRLCQDSPAKLVLVRCQFQNLHHLGYLFLMSGLLGDLMVPFGAWDCEFFQIIYLMGGKRVFLLDFFNWHIVNQGKAFKSVARAHRMPDFIRTDHRAV